ncbi:MAG: DUF4440 domain-containing protein [Roseovarius sp.]
MSQNVTMTQAPDSDALHKDLLAHETRVWHALQQGDANADRALLLPAFVGVYPSGFSDLAGHAAQLATGPSVASFSLGAVRAFAVGADHAMLCYLARFRRVGHDADEQMYVSSLWQRDGQGWRNLFSQDTPAASEPSD